METGYRRTRPAILVVACAVVFMAGWSAGRRTVPPLDLTGKDPVASIPAAVDESGSRMVAGRPPVGTTDDSPVALVHMIMTVSEQDLVAVVELIGKLAGLGDVRAKEAHDLLSAYPPRLDYVGALAMGYLWHRTDEVFDDVPFPAGWGLDYHREALMGGGVDPALVEARLRAGENVGAFARRVFFLGEIAKDPVDALVKWRRFSDVEGNFDELGLFGPAFADAGQRGRMMAVMFPAGEPVTTDTAFLVAALAATWMQRDFDAVEAWAKSDLPPQVRPVMAMGMLRHLAENEPGRALEWGEDELTEAQRAPAVDLALARMATSNPETAIRFLENVRDPALQSQHLQTFSLYHSLANYEDWNAWRGRLPVAQADRVAVAGFETWLNQDPAEASKWLNGFSNSPERAHLVSLMANRLIHGEDKATVMGWVDSLPDPSERAAAIAAAIRGCDPGDMETARALMMLAK